MGQSIPPMQPVTPLTAGMLLRNAVVRIRKRSRRINWKRFGCWLRLGHQLPLVLEHHTVTCKRCDHSWVE